MAHDSPQLAWLLLTAVAAIAIALVLLSISVRGHADNQRTVINKDLVIAFTIFTLMIPGNLFNRTVGGWFLHSPVP
ncbi:MAG: hypothetical protein WBD34_16670 [Burkholderiaceae bacterium]